MKRELKIDKAIYLVDGTTKSYQFLKRNLNWKNLEMVMPCLDFVIERLDNDNLCS